MNMTPESIARAQEIANRKALAERTERVFKKAAGVRMQLYFPVEWEGEARSEWPPTTLPVDVEAESPFFAKALKLLRAEMAREIAEADAELEAIKASWLETSEGEQA